MHQIFLYDFQNPSCFSKKRGHSTLPCHDTGRSYKPETACLPSSGGTAFRQGFHISFPAHFCSAAISAAGMKENSPAVFVLLLNFLFCVHTAEMPEIYEELQICQFNDNAACSPCQSVWNSGFRNFEILRLEIFDPSVKKQLSPLDINVE